MKCGAGACGGRLFYSFLKIYRPHSAVKFLLKLVLDGADLLADYSPGLPLI
jgi:hypothetical protein